MKKLLLAFYLIALTAGVAHAFTPTATATFTPTATPSPVPTPIIYPHQWDGISDNQGNTAVVSGGALNVTGGNITPGTNAFFVNPINVIPLHIYYVSSVSSCGSAQTSACSDSNNGTSPQTAFLTMGHAVTTAVSGDVIYVSNGSSFDEHVTVPAGKDFLSILAQRGSSEHHFEHLDSGADIDPVTALGIPLTIQSSRVVVRGIALFPEDDSYGLLFDAAARTLTGDVYEYGKVANFGPTKANIGIVASGGGSGAFSTAIRHSTIQEGSAVAGILISGGSTEITNIEDDYFDDSVSNTAADIQGTSSGGCGSYIVDNHFTRVDKAVYITIPNSGPADCGGPTTVFNNDFATATGLLTLTQVALNTNDFPNWNSPSGDRGSVLPPITNTLISSHITTAAAQNIFTASGDIDVTDIALTTSATGLAGGTNFVLSTDNTSGALTLCSNAVATLGANVSVKCSAAGVTSIKPFRLLSGKHILATCSVADCTGAGTITVTPIATRAAPYSSFTNVALP